MSAILVSFYATTTKVGNTSITIKVIVEAERFGSHGQVVRVTEAEVIYVAVSQNREKVKIGKWLAMNEFERDKFIEL